MAKARSATSKIAKLRAERDELQLRLNQLRDRGPLYESKMDGVAFAWSDCPSWLATVITTAKALNAKVVIERREGDVKIVVEQRERVFV